MSPPGHSTWSPSFPAPRQRPTRMVYPETHFRLIADDCLLYRVVDSINGQLLLQQDLKKLEDLADDWGMHFNATKCHIMAINWGDHACPTCTN